MAEPLVHRLRVRYAECDAQGVVFNAHYMAYLDLVNVEALRAAFGEPDPAAVAGVDTAVAEANLRFLAPARFDDELEVALRTEQLGTTSMTLGYAITRPADATHIVQARLRLVWVTLPAYTKTPIPDRARAAYAGWQADPADADTP